MSLIVWHCGRVLTATFLTIELHQIIVHGNGWFYDIIKNKWCKSYNKNKWFIFIIRFINKSKVKTSESLKDSFFLRSRRLNSRHLANNVCKRRCYVFCNCAVSRYAMTDFRTPEWECGRYLREENLVKGAFELQKTKVTACCRCTLRATYYPM